MIQVHTLENEYEGYVYDISLDGTFVNALGMNIVSNTDGINFQIPEALRYDEEHPYVSDGKGRNSVKGKAYTGIAADVREFEDMYLTGKNGLDIDEVVPSSINFRRKNYADLLSNNKVKLVGNSIKSKKMPLYIEKFLDVAIRLLLEGKGREFLECYYDYIEKIYNYRIPIKEIASVGKIKTSIETYKEECKKLTKGGTRKARQAWYELAIKENIRVNMGDAIYYINTGKGSGVPDVKRVTKFFTETADMFGMRQTDRTKQFTAEYMKLSRAYKEGSLPEAAKSKYTATDEDGKTYFVPLESFVEIAHPEAVVKDEIEFNCVMLPNEIVEDEEDRYCDDSFEYNVEKYIDMFNSRIASLFVCFRPEVREKTGPKGSTVSSMMITKPQDRKSFTDDECKLCSGHPFNPSDQDRLEDVLEMEDKEIRFWTSVGKKPPYIEECGMDWEDIKARYFKRQEQLMGEEARSETQMLNLLISRLKPDDIDKFNIDGILPASLSKLVKIEGTGLVSLKHNIRLASIYDIIDKTFDETEEEDMPENESSAD